MKQILVLRIYFPNGSFNITELLRIILVKQTPVKIKCKHDVLYFPVNDLLFLIKVICF